MLWNQDEELFLSGVGLLESFISNPDVLLNKEQYEQIVLLLQSYVFPFMATVTPEYQNMVLSAEDNETVDDSNEAHYIVKICLNSAFNWQYQRTKDAYLQFISSQTQNIGLYHFEVMMVDAMAVTELVPDNFDYEIIVQSILQLIQVDEPLIRLRVATCLSNIIKSRNDVPALKSELEKHIMAMTEVLLQTQNNLVQAQTLQLTANMVDQYSRDFICQHLDELILIIQNFVTSQNIVVSRNAMRVLEMVLSKVSTIRLQGISQMIIQIFLDQYKGLNQKMNAPEAKFLG